MKKCEFWDSYHGTSKVVAPCKSGTQQRTEDFTLFRLMLRFIAVIGVIVSMFCANVYAADTTLITFSEYPVGTIITNKYESLGVLFSVYGEFVPYISSDPLFPTSPVLAASSDFRMAINANFINPNDATKRASAINVSFDIGPFALPGDCVVCYEDVNGNYDCKYNESLEIEHYSLPGVIRYFGVGWARPQVVQGLDTISSYNFGVALDNLSFELIKEPEDCKLSVNADTMSSVNVADGSLRHNQVLFNTIGGNFSTTVSLDYDSTSTRLGSLGQGWSHNYEISLIENADGSIVLREGDTRRLYTLTGGVYIAEPGDHATLAKNPDGTFTISYRRGVKQNFSAGGQISSIVDRFGNNLFFDYYGDGDLTTVTDPQGRVTRFIYDTSFAPHRIKYIIDPNLNTYEFAFLENKFWRVINPAVTQDGTVVQGYWEYLYNSQGILKSKRDPTAKTTQYTYYPDQRVETAIDAEGVENPDGHTKTFRYPAVTGIRDIVTLIEKDDMPWLYTYDALSRALYSKTDPLGKVTSYTYYETGYMKSKTEPAGLGTNLSTFYSYDEYGNLTNETEAIDLLTYGINDPESVDVTLIGSPNSPLKWAFSYTYDNSNFDRIVSTTDLRSSPVQTITYTYTLVGGTEVITVTKPGDFQITTKHNPNGTIKEFIDANLKTTTFDYYIDTPDNRSKGIVGLLYSITGPDGVSVTFSLYDKSGNPREYTLTDSNGVVRIVTELDHDALNRLIMLTKIASGLPENVTKFDYDLVGNLKSLVDAETHETKYEYRYDRRLKKISNMVDGLPVETVFEYSGTGCSTCGGGVDKLTAVKDPNHVKNDLPGTVYQYDAAGRLEYETDPIGKKFRYTYYDNDLVWQKYDATTTLTLLVTYTYNNRGQLENKLLTDGTYEHYTYYPDGKLETAANQNISYTYLYYDNGRLWRVINSNGREIRYDEYDGLGQREKVTTFPGTLDERVIMYDYDGANRPWHVTSGAGTFTYTYDPVGRRDLLTYPNTTVTDRDFDHLNRLIGIKHNITGGAAFASYIYSEHDQMDNVESVTGDRNENYEYDPLYRILNVVSASPQTFTWDGAGNRLTGPSATDTNYSYNDANQMTTGKWYAFRYDNAGNQIEKAIPGVTAGTNYIWDAENRLTKVAQSMGISSVTTTFKYDPFGRRIQKDVFSLISGQIKTSSTSYVYDGEDIVLEIREDDSGTTKTHSTHGPGIDEPLAMERNGSYYFYHTDGLGSIVALTSQSGAVIQRYEYDSFGNIVTTSDPSFVQPYTYTGREWDRETGLYYYRARYYDPMEGRFISKDPIAILGNIYNNVYNLTFNQYVSSVVNPYAYVQNNPINLFDPEGLAGRGRFAAPKRPNYTDSRGKKLVDNIGDLPNFNMGGDPCVYGWYKKCNLNCNKDPRSDCKGPWFVKDISTDCYCDWEQVFECR